MLRMIAAVLNRVTVISKLSFLDVFCFLFESTFGPTFIIFAVLSSNKDLWNNPPRPTKHKKSVKYLFLKSRGHFKTYNQIKNSIGALGSLEH